MTGHRPFRELTEHLSPERRDCIETLSRELAAEMPLHELRRASAVTAPERRHRAGSVTGGLGHF